MRQYAAGTTATLTSTARGKHPVRHDLCLQVISANVLWCIRLNQQVEALVDPENHPSRRIKRRNRDRQNCKSRVAHTQQANGTEQNPEERRASPWPMHKVWVLPTLNRPPDCRQRYAEGPGDAPLADSAGHHLNGRNLLLLRQPVESAQFLAVRFRLLQARLGTGVGWTPVPDRTCRRRSRPWYSPRTTPANRGRHPGTGPKAARSRPGFESSLRDVAGRGYCPCCPARATRCGRWTPQPMCRPEPAGRQESTSSVGRWYRRYRRLRHPDRCAERHAGCQQQLTLGLRVSARQLGDSEAAGANVAVGLGHRSPSNWYELLYAFVTHTWSS